ncbi:MAG: 3'(2'),5'-bisphosphate nucleotidase CysQ [Rhizobiales bacterium]|nr:3'(2'),5'-bisphosphate nucleotidase CysQ [Hyphomicrobiales bacterium]
MTAAEMPASEADDAAALAVLEELALAAGRRIMEIHEAGFTAERKPDSSPVTEADRAAEKIILEGLRAAFPGIPCVAEEECAEGRSPGDLGDAFFLVDPLDGTKEFVKRRADFTVNIALIRGGAPELGVVVAPASGKMFSGRPGRAEEAEFGSDFGLLSRRPIAVRREDRPRLIVASRSHRTAETDAYISRFEGAEIISVGSSLKFCLLADGQADLYPRFGRTMEWDTAAGDAVLRAAGGMTFTLDGEPLLYGKRNQAEDVDFANPWFIAGCGNSMRPPAMRRNVFTN